MAALEDSLDEVVPELLRMTGTPGLSIAVAHRGQPVLARAYGLHDIAARTPLTPRSTFPAGSMTKLYTAVAVLQLVESGVIGLHDPVDRHLRDLRCINPLGAREITVHDLLTFRSGLATDTTGCSIGTPPPPLLEHVRTEVGATHGREYAGTVPRWGSRTGERYHYANLGISLLGLLVEQVNPDGSALETYLHDHVLEPLGMRDSRLSRWDDDLTADPRRATGYACFGDLAIPSPDLRSADFPANGLQTTPADHCRLLLALLGKGTWAAARVLRPETVRLMLTPQVSMAGGDGVWPGSDWWTGLVAIMSGLGGREAHFGHPGSHMWGWWSVSRAYPRLHCAVVACANGWDMLRWHNPANRDAATMAVELVARWFAAAQDGNRANGTAHGWARKRAFIAGALMAERTLGSLGAAGDLAGYASALGGVPGLEGFREGVRAATGDAPMDGARAARAFDGGAPDEQREALLHDLGMVYGCPAPLWFWPDPPPLPP
jgi:CubicO group peptidase (beta-lactamase class C family)